jgi:hypothetical protein
LTRQARQQQERQALPPRLLALVKVTLWWTRAQPLLRLLLPLVRLPAPLWRQLLLQPLPPAAAALILHFRFVCCLYPRHCGRGFQKHRPRRCWGTRPHPCPTTAPLQAPHTLLLPLLASQQQYQWQSQVPKPAVQLLPQSPSQRTPR